MNSSIKFRFLTFIFAVATSDLALAQGWIETGSLNEARSTSLTALPNGDVLAAGGVEGTAPGLIATNTVERYDPIKRAWVYAAPMSYARAGHTATRLQDGRILVVGGVPGFGAGDEPMAKVEIYDSAADVWIETGSLQTARSAHSATLLLDGRVLVAGGIPVGGESYLTSTELYDPDTGVWTEGPDFPATVFYPTAARLLDGRVLILGSYGYYDNAFIFNPVTSTMTMVQQPHYNAAPSTGVTLLDGRVLVTGENYGANSHGGQSAGEVYAPSTNIWTSNSMNSARAGQPMVLLPNGHVLAAGGCNYYEFCITRCDDYDPQTNLWTSVGSMQVTHGGGAALLGDGKVLIAGGDTNVAELYVKDLIFYSGLDH